MMISCMYRAKPFVERNLLVCSEPRAVGWKDEAHGKGDASDRDEDLWEKEERERRDGGWITGPRVVAAQQKKLLGEG